MTDTFTRLKTALSDRYTIESELGQGGMATVYLARDLKHDRQVAVKVLRPDLARDIGADRFLQEIKLTAQLEHPHILTLIDSGEADGFLYYVMPYVEGESLRSKLEREGELPVEEAVSILREMTDALGYAHEKGIVHRDVKPDNVLFSGGHVVVTDFGVAKAVRDAAVGSSAITTAGSALGTPAYMAPEQAAADPGIDHRADVYAIGCVAYELLTGRPPFTGSNAQQVLSAQVTQMPDAVTRYRQRIPASLETVVMRCLEKHAADRWQTAAEVRMQLAAALTPGSGSQPITDEPRRRYLRLGMAVALVGALGLTGWFWLRDGVGSIDGDVARSIAVLPFTDMSPEGDQAYFGDGVAEEILNALSRLENLQVASRSSSFRLRDEEASTIGRRLDVGHVLDGSVRRQGDQLRVTAQLVTTHDGFQLWSETFNGTVNDVFAMQESISRAVVSALQVQLGVRADRELGERGTANVDAYDRYLTGRFQWNRRTLAGLEAAIESFEAAIRFDPNYTNAYLGIAEAYAIFAGQALLPGSDVIPAAEDAIRAALAIDNDVPEALRARGLVHVMAWEFAQADSAFRQAIRLAPNDACTRYFYSTMFHYTGRHYEAAREMKLARELDPRTVQIAAGEAEHFRRTGDISRALELNRLVLENDPSFPYALKTSIWSYFAMDSFPEALQAIEQLERSGRVMSGYRAIALWGLDRIDEAHRLVNDAIAAREGSWFHAQALVAFYLLAGDRDNGLRWLEITVSEKGDAGPLVSEWMLGLDDGALRNDPRFVRLMSESGIGGVR